MKVGIIGSGGREHSICESLKKSEKLTEIFCFPGNAGTEDIAKNVTLDLDDFRNLKIEFLLMPIFLVILFILAKENYSLFQISLLILLKELILLFLRLNFLKYEIKNVKEYYFFLIYFLLILFLSFNNMDLYYFSLILLILSLFKK